MPGFENHTIFNNDSVDSAPQINADHIKFAIRIFSLGMSSQGYAIAFGYVAKMLPAFAMAILDIIEENHPEVLGN